MNDAARPASLWAALCGSAASKQVTGSDNWLRPSAIDGWRHLSAQLVAHPEHIRDQALTRLRTNYAGTGFDFIGAAAILNAAGPAPSGLASSYRVLIEAVARRDAPAWLTAVPRGRTLLMAVLDADGLMCFERAELLASHPEPEAVELLDRLAQLARGAAALDLMNSARQAERLSLDLERERCAAIAGAPVPEWVALDNNAAGYDILSSRLDHSRITPKLVEVKSSRAHEPILILTRNEWEIGSRNPSAWVVHFWNMRNQTLIELTWHQLCAHMPLDQGAGRWETAVIALGSCAQKN